MFSRLEFAVRVRPPLQSGDGKSVGLYVDPSNDKVVVGYDVSFISFGRSKSGKTHSLAGQLYQTQNSGPIGQNYGVIPRAAAHIFDFLNKTRQGYGINFNVYFSFFEISNDEFKEIPVNNSFTSRECNSVDDVVECLKLVLKDSTSEPNNHVDHSNSHLFFALTVQQQWLQNGKLLAKSSRCTFVELGSCNSNISPQLNNEPVQNPRLSTSGLNLISKVLSGVSSNESNLFSQVTTPGSETMSLLMDIVKYSSKTVLLFCVSPTSADSPNSLIDLMIIEQLRLLYGTSFDKKTSNQEANLTNNLEQQNCNEETLSLEFAASQWHSLVSNAEVLFKKLAQGSLSHDAKGQIDQWLFLKQEFEDCFKPDVTGHGKVKSSLGRIDEVTESGSKTSLEISGDSAADNDDSDESDEYRTREPPNTQKESKKRIFTEQLSEHLQRFRALTDRMIDQQKAQSVRNCSQGKTIPGKLANVGKKARNVDLFTRDGKPEMATMLNQHPAVDRQIKSDTSPEIAVNRKHAVLTQGGSHPNVDLLRVEIASLRATKDYLHEQKRELTAKINETKYVSNAEQRKLIEADEAIDAIDSAMEFKNELLCGRNALSTTDLLEKGEQMLTDRLLNLSPEEMRILLCKYFRKVVDLREAGRKMEKVISDLDHQLETQAWKINALSNALQLTRIECDRKLVMVLKEQEKKYQLNFRHYAGDSSEPTNSSVDNKSDNACSHTGPLFEIGGTGTGANQVEDKALTIPQQNLRKLQGSSTHTTKVTRKGNKLIIQQERSKKK
ncbi:Kinesin-like protein costa [Nesidiocoris tenuis]|uniref:Kinesin-like protein costa n=1 Tax=Nesidiocoris tenuis TaxID=355587 RepID=A0ABN7AIW1_9HEMI|nr:Kinesin-like protein costa [Nesidiocoris tenuis]